MRRALWRFLKEYGSYTRSYFRFMFMLLNPNILMLEIPIKQIINDEIVTVLIGGFIIKLGKVNTYILNMAFILNNEGENIFIQAIARTETLIFMTNPNTIIHYSVGEDNKEVINKLIKLGYSLNINSFTENTLDLIKTRGCYNYGKEEILGF